MSRSSVSTAWPSAKLNPAELARSGANRFTGSGMRGCATRSSASTSRDRVGHHFFGRQARIDDAIDERSVGAVLEQPTHEIWQAGPRARRPARTRGRQLSPWPAHRRCHRAPRPCHAGAGTRSDSRRRRTPRRHARWCARCAWRTADRSRSPALSSSARAGEIGHVGIRLAREYRIARSPRSCARLISLSQYAPLTSRSVMRRSVAASRPISHSSVAYARFW